MRYAAVDLGGWDTHDGQGTAGSGYHYYQNQIAELSQALAAFYGELETGGEIGRVTVVVQSEFGRRVRKNGSRGTDHGYGNPLLVLGGAVHGRSEEHTSELKSLMRSSYAVFCLKNKNEPPHES